MDGFLNLLKPPGMTSSDAVVFVRRSLGVKAKVGHARHVGPGSRRRIAGHDGKASAFLTCLSTSKKPTSPKSHWAAPRIRRMRRALP